MSDFKSQFPAITSNEDFLKYSRELERLVFKDKKTEEDEEKIIWLTSLIKYWDKKKLFSDSVEPVDILKGLMQARKLKQKDLVKILELSKSQVSLMLSGRREWSKKSIRILAQYFDVPQELFNPTKEPVPVKKDVDVNAPAKKVVQS